MIVLGYLSFFLCLQQAENRDVLQKCDGYGPVLQEWESRLTNWKTDFDNLHPRADGLDK